MRDLTAILLCGGKGERLKPFTEQFPKPMVPLGGRPILFHLVKYLAAAGLERFLLCTGYKAEVIEQFVAAQLAAAFAIRCVNSGDVSMTDRLLDARAHATGRVLVCYGDTLANVDLVALRRAHEASGALATLTTHPLRSPFGVVYADPAGRVQRFEEKPLLPYWINIGFLLCEPAALDRLERGSDMPAFLEGLAKAGRLGAYTHPGKHLTVNTEKDRAQAETEIVELFTV